MTELDPDQEAALRRLRAAFGFVEILKVVDHEADQDRDDNEADKEEASPGRRPIGESAGSCQVPRGTRELDRDVSRTSRRRCLASPQDPRPALAPVAERCASADEGHLGSTPLRAGLVAVAVAAVVVAVWLWRHAWVLVGIGRSVRGYLDGWAIGVEHGFGLVERAKIAVAFGLHPGSWPGPRCSGWSPRRSWPCWVGGGELCGCAGVGRSEAGTVDRR